MIVVMMLLYFDIIVDMNTSFRSENLPVSAVRKLIPFAQEAKKRGTKVYHLNIGQPDVPSPTVMVNSLQNWNENLIPYAPSLGTDSMRNAMRSYYAQLGYTNISAENHIVVTVGASDGIVMVLFTLCNPGDEVLVFEPFYSGYNALAQLAGVTLVPIERSIETGFHLPDRETIEKSISKKTKAILFPNPCNPSGIVYTQKEVEMLLQIAEKSSLTLISDEVYREYVFVDRPHVSLLSYIDQLPNQIIVIDSLSKRYNLCGLRIGFLTTKNTDIFQGLNKIAMSKLSAGYIAQYVGSHLTKVSETYLSSMQAEYRNRRDLLYEKVTNIDGVRMSKPEGAFYSMVKLPVQDAESFCIWMLESFEDQGETVMMAPGNGFYTDNSKGVDEVRIAYVLNLKDLSRSIDILQKGLTRYSSENR